MKLILDDMIVILRLLFQTILPGSRDLQETDEEAVRRGYRGFQAVKRFDMDRSPAQKCQHCGQITAELLRPNGNATFLLPIQ